MARITIPSEISGSAWYAIYQLQSGKNDLKNSDSNDIAVQYFSMEFDGGSSYDALKTHIMEKAQREEDDKGKTTFYGFAWEGDPNNGAPKYMFWDDANDQWGDVPYSEVQGIKEYFGTEAVNAFLNRVDDVSRTNEWNTADGMESHQV